MNFGDLFSEENRAICRWLGVVFTVIPVLFFFSRPIMRNSGFAGYLGEWLVVSLTVMMILGIIFLATGFSKSDKEADKR